MSAVLVHGGIRGITLPPLHSGVKGLIGKVVTTDAEIDQLRIDAVRRCEAVTVDLQRLKSQRLVPFAELVEALADPARFQRNLVESVPFDAADAVEAAAEKLRRILGDEGTVADPRCEYIGAVLTMGNVRELVAGMSALIEPYRRMRASLK